MLQNSPSTGSFWNIDQRSNLFPATISDDSPLKQEMPSTSTDPEQENETQEAIEHYFSQNHPHFASPPAATAAESTGRGGSTMPMDDTAAPNMADVAHSTALVGGDEDSQGSIYRDHGENLLDASSLQPSLGHEGGLNHSGPSSVDSSRRSSLRLRGESKNQWSQTTLTLPPVLPPELEMALKSFCT